MAGTMFLMWLGEQITERGLGNGISILIFAGIAAGLPSAIGAVRQLVSNGSMSIVAALFITVLTRTHRPRLRHSRPAWVNGQSRFTSANKTFAAINPNIECRFSGIYFRRRNLSS